MTEQRRLTASNRDFPEGPMAVPTPTQRRYRIRRVVFFGAYSLLLLLALEALSMTALAVVRPHLEEPILKRHDILADQTERLRSLLDASGDGLVRHDRVLGWRYKPGFRSPSQAINLQGLRSEKEYDPEPAPGVLRVAAFGDSYVFANEVSNEHAWPSLIEDMHTGIEVLNYGVGGYGVDQALLRYLVEGLHLSPAVVLIGFAPIDLRRVVNVYRRFLSVSEGPATKPRFFLTDTGTELLPNPIRTLSDWERYLKRPTAIKELGRFDHWYQPMVYEWTLYDYSASLRLAAAFWTRLHRRYLDKDRLLRDRRFNQESEAFKLQLALFHRFVNAAHEFGAAPAILFLPGRESVVAARNGRETVYAPVVEEVRRRGYPYFDAIEAFSIGAPADISSWFMPGGHYSPLANRLIADWLGSELMRRFAADH